MTRRILSSRIGGFELIGTHHVPEPHDAPNAVGLLLLNAGPAPRAGNSDLSVRVCDELALRGVHGFRFDLPGLGDSAGVVPDRVDAFWREVIAGRNDEATLRLLADLSSRFALARMVVGGLCAGAVTSIRAADRDCTHVAGLLLLEPNLRTSAEARGSDRALEPGVKRRSKARKRLAKIFSLRSWLHVLIGPGPVGRAAQPIRPLVHAVLRTMIGHSLPADANRELVLTWLRVIEQRVPTLVLAAAGKNSDRICRAVHDSLPTECRDSVDHVSIHGTNHILTAGDARDRVVAEVRSWFQRRFADDAIQTKIEIPEGRREAA